MTTTTAARDVLDQLVREHPRLHGAEETTSLNVLDAVSEWLFGAVAGEMTTLETGCGASSIIFAIKGSDHTVISPLPQEHERIRRWCASHGVGTERVRFLVGGSEAILPAWEPRPLDLVLIDGNHNFPVPFIDWFYTAEALKVGGLVVVDDTNIRSCGVLCDFLRAEKGRWEVDQSFLRTTVFRKVAERASVGESWALQPWSTRPSSFREALKQNARVVGRATLGRFPGLKSAALEAYHRLATGRRRPAPGKARGR